MATPSDVIKKRLTQKTRIRYLLRVLFFVAVLISVIGVFWWDQDLAKRSNAIAVNQNDPQQEEVVQDTLPPQLAVPEDTTLTQTASIHQEVRGDRTIDFSDPPVPGASSPVQVSRTADNMPSPAPDLWRHQKMPDYASLSLKSKFRLIADTRYHPQDKAKLLQHILDLFENGEKAEVQEIYLEANGQEISKSFPLKLYLLRLEENKGDIIVSSVEEIRGTRGLTGLKVKV